MATSRMFFVDIGPHVQQGQLMAIIETPEVDQQLQVARSRPQERAGRSHARRHHRPSAIRICSKATPSRSRKPTSPSAERQPSAPPSKPPRPTFAASSSSNPLSTFTHPSPASSPPATPTSARSSTPARQRRTQRTLPHRLHRQLRVFVAVPEIYAPAIRDGDTARLTLDEFPGQQFTGRVARNSNAIDTASRTLNVEVDVRQSAEQASSRRLRLCALQTTATAGRISPFPPMLCSSVPKVSALPSSAMAACICSPSPSRKDNGATLEVAAGLDPSDTDHPRSRRLHRRRPTRPRRHKRH